MMGVALVFSVSVPVQAAGQATIGFSPTSKSVEQGASFNIDIVVNSNGESIDTVRAFLSFDPSLLQVENFSLGSLYPNVSPGNIVDNQNGYLSEGGFAKNGQISTSGEFGTITFKTKQAGEANLRIVSGSRLISIGEEKISDAGYGQATINITAVEPEVEAVAETLPEVSQIEVPTDPGATEVSYLQVMSRTHPNQRTWSNDNNLELNWGVTGEPLYNVSNYLYDFDQDPDTDPTSEVDASVTQLSYEDVEDGVWYMHVKAEFEDGSQTKAVHFKVMVDTRAPGPVVPVLDQSVIEFGQTTYVRFGTIDQTSGIAYYEVGIDEVFTKGNSPFPLEDLGPGKHTITVRAVDGAGNSVTGETEIEVTAGIWETYRTQIIVIIAVVLVALLIILRRKFLKN